jgi:hypothetical protein
VVGKAGESGLEEAFAKPLPVAEVVRIAFTHVVSWLLIPYGGWM